MPADDYSIATGLAKKMFFKCSYIIDQGVKRILVESGIKKGTFSPEWDQHEESISDFDFAYGRVECVIKTLNAFNDNSLKKSFDLVIKEGACSFIPIVIPKKKGNMPRHNVCHPVPLDNEIIAKINSVISDEMKDVARTFDYSANNPNKDGFKDKLQAGVPAMPFTYNSIDHLDVPDPEEMSEEEFLALFDEEAIIHEVGTIQAIALTLIDDKNEICRLPVPKIATDPTQFHYDCLNIKDKGGYSPDCNMDPDFGRNKTNKQDSVYTVLPLLEEVLKVAVERNEQRVLLGGNRNWESVMESLWQTMTDKTVRGFITTFFNTFEKLELNKVVWEMIKNDDGTECEIKKFEKAVRLIFAPGGLEFLCNSILVTPLAIYMSRRFNRGYTHGVSAKDGGMHEMLWRVMRRRKYTAKSDEWSALKSRMSKVLGGKNVRKPDLDYLLSIIRARDDDVSGWDLNINKQMLAECYVYVTLSYDIDLDCLSKDDVALVMIMLLGAIVITNVTCDFGDGPILVQRVLPSGCVPTAHFGSFMHGKMDASYRFKQAMAAHKVNNEFQKLRGNENLEERELKALDMLDSAYACFEFGITFCHHSDDCFTLMNKMAIVFAEFVDRNSFMSDMYGLTFKVNKKEYVESDYMGLTRLIGHIVKKFNLGSFMAACTDYYQGTRDGKYDGPKEFATLSGHKICHGSKPFVETYDYITRCQNWGRIDTQFRENGTIELKGLNFLKNYFVIAKYNNRGRQLVPRRELGELWAKLMLPKAYYDTPVKRLAQLKSMAYFFVFEQWGEFMEVYNWFIRERMNGSNEIEEGDLDRRTLEDYFYMLGGDNASFNFKSPPCYPDMLEFYRHKGLKTGNVKLKEIVKRDSFKRLASKIPIFALIGRLGFHPNATTYKF